MSDLRWIGQEDAQGCGAAVLAMLTGQTYAAVKADMDADPWVCEGGERNWAAHGLTSHVLDRYLAARGYFLRRIYDAWGIVESWPPEPFAPLHFARVRQPSGHGHFVAMDRTGRVFDPLREGAFTLADWSEVQNVVGLLRGT